MATILPSDQHDSHTHTHTHTQSLVQAADMCCLVPRSTGGFLTALQQMKAVVTT